MHGALSFITFWFFCFLYFQFSFFFSFFFRWKFWIKFLMIKLIFSELSPLVWKILLWGTSYCHIIFKSLLPTVFYIPNVYRGDIGDDPLDDQGAIQQVMEQIAIICRCEYEKSAELIIRLFDHDYTIYEHSASNPSVFFFKIHFQTIIQFIFRFYFSWKF